ncbi:MAG: 50S ribosomal protein L32 [bacterium (Candidatus Ratteibacteria) CG_4_10_14_3_um_filter_41_18]|uniref:Large ribosomal subunit protein bL32 n=4 Tax=Candidatus Ratteibacteria TaxID=2979319 RepID=A0A2M7E929_9BACT|nr:MAG: 50S ribosomal protein L32 [bacterium (Candidatus Ratteibacteria) CG01_land_8_20_14_3_00_40_19]PIW33053.1 MAG: 50S ribosomal protein L32 [bacterium (Candidatus Ratteibacteria) CG15_BIG_FIL_POST_REV_8_21_14_020_41_12]PIX76697.1 MAG: 50S ribosomal protein L32 [bacterium (Candidatus Ratteibacteria) CG_4_10_14_3_um_filter_41_18]PJA61279.1 MAG: 50S ribosomal protein L32 [bacterium (Candidatus Ratteibacteria) CG_4_9_14_3_um_filter_41_21]HCG76375.1 50S ribosomal protein L32 [bacterium]
MPNPKRRHSKSRGGKRRGSVHCKLSGLSPCPHCKQLRLSHHVCPHCGYYGEKPILIKREKKKEK